MRKIMFLLSALTVAMGFSIVANANQIDLKKSTFEWKATKKIGSFHHGNIFLKSAKADIKKDQIVGGEFVMDMKSFTVTDLEGEWRDKFLGHVKSGDFFEVEKYDTAKLVIGKADGDTAEGKLTIKDKTQPVKVKFTKNGKAYTGTMIFDRTQFGIIYNSGNFFKDLAADKIINNDVEVKFNVVLN